MYTVSEDIKRYRPILSLSRFLSRRTLSRLRFLFATFAITSGAGAALIGVTLPGHPTTGILVGVSLLCLALWIEQLLIYSYHNSYYFHGLSSVLGQSQKDISGVTYEVAEALSIDETDITKAFCLSSLGSIVLLRSGLDATALANFLQQGRLTITTLMVPLPKSQIFSLISLGQYLLQQDAAFKVFLKESAVSEETFLGALNWVIISYHEDKKNQRWWGRDNLSKTKGIGRSFAYGTPYLLEKFSRDLRTGAVYANFTNKNSSFTDEKIAEITVALARAKAANVLIIGEAGVGKIDLLLEVSRRLAEGKAVGAVEDQNFILLDTNRLFATHRDKQELEFTLINLFTEAANAGNIIIVIENISNFIREAETMGIFVPELLDPFLATPTLHVIGTDTPGAYHTYLEPLGGFSRRFAEVIIDAPDLSSTTRVLQNIAAQTEAKYQTLFTYEALTTITSAADRYLVEGVMPDKAIELLLDIATRASQSSINIVTPDFVYQVVSAKTGIPTGPVGEVERDLLLNLESKLHERVVGQQRALDAISRTMRRARAGIQSSDKPIGSFLFLGPTGVGKTETAKALAHVFFGDEATMHRIDMSEFSGPDALPRLIGDGINTGTLSNMLREHPYSVLLLDEFEKGAKSVHDIFLQILDEGIFTDARGERINARNTIIIATSNAGSDLILRTVAQRVELATLTQEIINHIIDTGVYRPELLNRFDSTVIFEPLTLEEQSQVASLMLGGLYQRVKSKGYELQVTKELMDILVARGYDPQFGARPMQRILQDVIEEKVASMIISGQVKRGGTISLSAADLTQ